MIWMAVTADEYELPLIVEPTSTQLAEKLGITTSTLITKAKRDRERESTKKKTKPSKFGTDYLVVKVEE